MRTATAPIREMHVALVGMAGSGKSALTVKYITKRFIGEYDPSLEDTYCKQDTVAQQPLMVWLMDTVDDTKKDDMRWIAWADVYLIVYDVTSQLSLQYAESLLEKVSQHEHLLCAREHRTILLGNKSDLERYRQVSEADASRTATKYGAAFAETNAVGDPRPLAQLLHETFTSIVTGTRSPSPRMCSSDSEITNSTRKSGFSFRSSSRTSHITRKGSTSTGKQPSNQTNPSTPPTPLHKSPSISKLKTGSKLLKLFHNS